MSKPVTLEPASSQNLNINSQLDFSKRLQAVAGRVNAASNIDEIMLEVSKDICTLFNADRLTIYTISEDKSYIISRVKTGLDSFQDLKLPITEQSIAGFAGLNKKIVNVADV